MRAPSEGFRALATSERTHVPQALGSVIRSRQSGITLVRLRAGWVNYNQSVAHADPQDIENWTVLFDNAGQGMGTADRIEGLTEQIVNTSKAITILRNSLREAREERDIPGYQALAAELANLQARRTELNVRKMRLENGENS